MTGIPRLILSKIAGEILLILDSFPVCAPSLDRGPLGLGQMGISSSPMFANFSISQRLLAHSVWILPVKARLDHRWNRSNGRRSGCRVWIRTAALTIGLAESLPATLRSLRLMA